MFSFTPVSPPRPYTPPSPHLYTPHAQPISFFSILSPAQYWVSSTDHLAPRYAISSIPPLPRHSWVIANITMTKILVKAHNFKKLMFIHVTEKGFGIWFRNVFKSLNSQLGHRLDSLAVRRNVLNKLLCLWVVLVGPVHRCTGTEALYRPYGQ